MHNMVNQLFEDCQRPRTKIDKNISPSFALPYRECHNTTNIVVLRTSFLFAEISHEARAKPVDLSHHIEEERFDIIKETLMIQEHL